MRAAHIEMVGGAAGDMLLAAFVDAGADPEALEAALRTIEPDGWTLRFEPAIRRGIAARRALLEVPGEDPELEEPSPHEHAPGGRARPRMLAEVTATLERSGLSARQKERATAIYRRLAEAEASVHGTTPERIHFHEVGALDAILDVAGLCVALDLLGVERLTCSAFPVGRGRIRMQHGLFPNPPPATARLLLGSPVEALDVEAELVSPTAAAILTTLVARPGLREPMTPVAIGYGAGRRDLPIPNVLRVTLGDVGAEVEPATISVIEANIDDMSPQHYALALERLFAAGARDVWMTPVTMKKQRPAIVLSAIALPSDEEAVARVMLAETTTIGVRVRTERKYLLARRIVTVETPLGGVRVKIAGTGPDARALPEHDDLVRIARERAMPLPVVAAIVAASALGLTCSPP